MTIYPYYILVEDGKNVSAYGYPTYEKTKAEADKLGYEVIICEPVVKVTKTSHFQTLSTSPLPEIVLQLPEGHGVLMR